MLDIKYYGGDPDFIFTTWLADAATFSQITPFEVSTINTVTGLTSTLDGIGFFIDLDSSIFAGTIRSIDFSFANNGQVVATFDGISWTLLDWLASMGQLLTTDDTTFFADLLSRQDINIDASQSTDALDLTFYAPTFDLVTSDMNITGSNFNDTMIAGLGDDTIDGGAGTDQVNISGTRANATITQDGQGVRVVSSDGTDILQNVETVFFQGEGRSYTINELLPNSNIGNRLIGTPDDDALRGGSGDETINGLAGDDQIAASAGNDLVVGGDGNDNIGGGLGNDTVNGGSGNDTIGSGRGNDVINAEDGDDVMSGGIGNDRVLGGAGNDTMAGSFGADTVNGGDGNDDMGGGFASDLLVGGAGNDTMGAGLGNDTVLGGDGNDLVLGGGNNDRLDGGTGNDTLAGGAGNDILTGGAGADVFVFNVRNAGEQDIVTDFTAGVDSFAARGFGGDPLNVLQLTQQGSDVLVEFSDDFSVIIQNVSVSDL